jgi:hypothetical protein
VDEEMSERLLRRRVKRLAMGMEHPPESDVACFVTRWRPLHCRRRPHPAQ